MKKLAALFMAASVMGPVAAQAQAQMPSLSPQQEHALEIARAYNSCMKARLEDPVYHAAVEAYRLEKEQAEALHKIEMDSYVVHMRKFNEEYHRIAARDGYDKKISEINGWSSKLDRGFGGAVGIIDASIEAIRQEVYAKVLAETGLTYMDFPASENERMTLKEPQDPVFLCDKQVDDMLKTKKIDSYDIEKILSSVIRQRGSDYYLKAVEPRP